MKDVITIIVPVYNTAEYLDQCVQSILNQSYRNLEIILVDDGSTDLSGSICDKYAVTDIRVRVIHQQNKGISEARNRGLDIAQGQYVTFVDSDDFIAPKMYEILINEMRITDADIVICNFACVDEEDNIIERQSPICNETLSVSSLIHKLYLNNFWYYTVVWNRIYKKEIFKTLRFNLMKVNEDNYIFYDSVKNARKIVTIQSPLYFYRRRIGSVMVSSMNIKKLDGIEAAYLAFRKCEIENRDYLLYMYFFARHQIYNISLINRDSKNDHVRVKEIKKMFRYMFLNAPGNKNMKNMLQALLPEMYYALRKFVKHANNI